MKDFSLKVESLLPLEQRVGKVVHGVSWKSGTTESKNKIFFQINLKIYDSLILDRVQI